jgi:hypothetical protein
MSMENIRVLNQNVNPTVTEVCQWLTKKAECGDIPESSARLGAIALKQLAANLDEGEPEDDAAWVRDNLDRLANRWSTRNPDSKGDTARSYQGRAKGALDKYFGWRENPSAFKFERRARKPANESAATKEEPKAAPAPAAAAPQPPPPPPPPAQPTGESHRFRVGPDKYVHYELPPDGLTIQEWKRLCVNMLTMCVDYNPDEPSPTLALNTVR